MLNIKKFHEKEKKGLTRNYCGATKAPGVITELTRQRIVSIVTHTHTLNPENKIYFLDMTFL